MLIFEENNQRKVNKFKKNDQNSPSRAKNLNWKYQKSKNSRNLIQPTHRKFKERIYSLVSSQEMQFTIKGRENKGRKTNKENEEKGE